MRIEERLVGNVMVLSVIGPLTMGGLYADLEVKVSGVSIPNVLLVMTECLDIDSYGLFALEWCTRWVICSRPGQFKLTGVQPAVMEFIRRADPQPPPFEIYPIEADAIASFQPTERTSDS